MAIMRFRNAKTVIFAVLAAHGLLFACQAQEAEPSVDGVKLEKVKEIKFSKKRGIYLEPELNVEISSATPDAIIQYTTDNTDPETSVTSILHVQNGNDPLVLTMSASAGGKPGTPSHTVRAFAHKEGMRPSDQKASTYIFPAFVAKQYQPHEYPETWSYNIKEMTSEEVEASLKSLPILAISGDPEDLFGEGGVLADMKGVPTQNDVKDKGGKGGKGPIASKSLEEIEADYVEVPVSVEMFYSDDRSDWTNLAGLRAHSKMREEGKRSLRLVFKDKFGDKKLKEKVFKDAVFNSKGAQREFDVLVLRAGRTDTLFGNECERNGTSTYVVDQLARDSQIAMSGYGARGVYAHLFLNGLYWGLYNIGERPDKDFFSHYLGGKSKNWFVGNAGGPLDGDDENLRELNRVRNQFQKVQELLDVESFADYMLYNFYAGVGDWPGNNFYVGYRNSSDEGEDSRIKYVIWDAEDSWIKQGPEKCGGKQLRSNAGAWVSPSALGVSNVMSPDGLRFTDDSQISVLWRALHNDKNFLTIFGDRVYRNCFNDGALTDANIKTRFRGLTGKIDKAIELEAARWGDKKAGGGVWTKADWLKRTKMVEKKFMTGNCEKLIKYLRNTEEPSAHPPYYPPFSPPTFVNTSTGNAVETSFINAQRGDFIRIERDPTLKAGITFYTTNGVDPRVPGRARKGKGKRTRKKFHQIKINSPFTLLSRTKVGKNWSALHKLEVYLVNDYSPLKVTEIMYNPRVSDELEFIELYNSGRTPLSMELLNFNKGIQLKFPLGKRLESESYGILVRNVTAFQKHYGKEITPLIIGEFEKNKLSNSGERLKLIAPDGTEILDMEWNDKWYPITDGDGYSLVLNDCALPEELKEKFAWRPSTSENGSPGERDPAQVCDYGTDDQEEKVSNDAKEPSTEFSTSVGEVLTIGDVDKATEKTNNKKTSSPTVSWTMEDLWGWGVTDPPTASSPDASSVTWDSCYGKCACNELKMMYCCGDFLFEEDCAVRAIDSPKCQATCA